MKKIKWWDEYEIKARYIPTFLSSIPLVQFLLLFLGKSFWSDLSGNIGWMLVANIGLSLIVMLALVQIQCGFAKHWIEEPVFGKGSINFPTTNMLLLNTTLISTERKEQIRNKISKLFGCTFSTIDEESNNPANARLQARDAVNSVRTAVSKGNMTLQYNIRYGFFRNFIGGVIWSGVGSLGCSIIYGIDNDWKPMILFIVLLIVHILTFVLKKPILDKFSFTYADYLFNDFLDYHKGAK